MKALVTGANGQLGKCLQDLSKKESRIEWVFKGSKSLDITNKKKIEKLFLLEKFDYVINCAAYTAVDKAEIENKKAFLVNAEGVKNLAEICKKYNTVVIHISTDFVFDGVKTTPYSEKDITNPINVYGASKLKGEKYLENILDSYFIIRTSWVYSEYGSNFVKTMLKLSEERNELAIISDQIGCPTYAKDLSKALLKMVISRNNSFGLYHFSNSGVTSWYDFAKAIFELKKNDVILNPIPTTSYPTPAKRPKYSVLNKEKITNNFSVETPYWKESLKRCLNKL